MLQTDLNLNKDQIQALHDCWNEQAKGLHNTGGVPILTAGLKVMRETGKSALRRARDPTFVKHYFCGDGIDIGAGNDPLGAYRHIFPLMKEVVAWDVGNGDASLMPGVWNSHYDFAHSSHCLEHLPDPSQALIRWLEIVKPGGYVIITVPDEDLYEKGIWPSRFNPDHRVSFTMGETKDRMPKSINVLEMVSTMLAKAFCERIVLIRDFYDEGQAAIDQTAYGLAECAIEIVLRKR